MKTTLETVPNAPGIYLFKDHEGTILYIGKAKSIRKRLATYFKRHQTDWKVNALIEDYAIIDFIITNNEQQALLLEAQLISEHKPKYNVLLKDGQPYLYILLTKDELPLLKLVRNKQEKGTYFGPFLQKMQTRSAFRYLINTFRLKLCNATIQHGCLDYHLGLCAGSCLPHFDSTDYLFRIQLATDALKKDHKTFLKRLNKKIEESNRQLAFEKSKHLHEYVENFDSIFTTLKARFSPRSFEHAIVASTTPKLYVAATDNEMPQYLQQFLGTKNPIISIDCFDVSHFQSKQIVGSCIRFVNGKPDKSNFRRFNVKTLTEQNDYAALQEIISRRYRNPEHIPDLILIDGGKGQLSAAKSVLPTHVPCISLAKREETIFSDNHPHGIKLDIATDIGKLLIALRDYTHHFAITFHRIKRNKQIGENNDSVGSVNPSKPRVT